MIELPLIFVAGVLGSSHCLGMCGPFVFVLGSTSPHWSANFRRQIIFTLGRVFTYSTMGCFAGAAGLWFSVEAPVFLNAAASLAIAAGLFLTYQGLKSVGWLPPPIAGTRIAGASKGPCLAGTFLSTWLRSARWYDTFLAGLGTGLLPCGLVYGFLALAAASGSLIDGTLIMAAFGLGTAPLMILAGCGGGWLDLALRHRLQKVAAWCVVVAGCVSMARGVAAFLVPGSLALGDCPLCP